MASNKGKVEYVQGKNRRHGWFIASKNGTILAMSPPRGYRRLTDAKRAVRRTRDVLKTAAA